MLYPSACAAKIHCVPPGAGLPAAARRRSRPGPRADRAVPARSRPSRSSSPSPGRWHKKNLAGLVDLYGRVAGAARAANLVIVAGLRDGPDSGEAEQRAVIGDLLPAWTGMICTARWPCPSGTSRPTSPRSTRWRARRAACSSIPRSTEPYGLTLTEAALHGVPVVATCHGGPADIVADLGHGRQRRSADGDAFADAMIGCSATATMGRAPRGPAGARVRGHSWHGYAERIRRDRRGA